MSTHGGSPPAVALTGVLKRHRARARPAVSGLDLRVSPGEVLGLLGPNGAGKTTTLLLVLGLLKPDAGRVEVLGHRAGDVAVRGAVGYMPDRLRGFDAATLRALLTVAAAYTNGRARRREADHVLSAVGLSESADLALGRCSTGTKKRLALGLALLGRRRLLVLDEPTAGLDPPGQVLVRDVVRRVRDQGGAVLLSSHCLGEVERCCDRVAFMHRGALRDTSSVTAIPEGLEARFARMARRDPA